MVCTVLGRLRSPQSEPIKILTGAKPKLFLWVIQMFMKRSGFVYAVLFSDGWVKVGRGKNPEIRIASHVNLSAMRNAAEEKRFISGRIIGHVKAELEIINFCLANGERAYGREWFKGIDFSKLESFMADSFSGDSEDDLASHSIAADKNNSSVAERIVCNGRSCSNDYEPSKWDMALMHARLIEKSLLNEMYSGEMFEQKGSMSWFVSLAALAINSMNSDEESEVYHMVTEDPDSAINLLIGKGNTAYLIHTGQMQPKA